MSAIRRIISLGAGSVTDEMLKEVYLKLNGRKGGQEAIGGTETGNKLILKGNSVNSLTSKFPAVVEGVGGLFSANFLKAERWFAIFNENEATFPAEAKLKTIKLRKRSSLGLKAAVPSTVTGIVFEGEEGGSAPPVGAILILVMRASSKPITLIHETEEEAEESETIHRLSLSTGQKMELVAGQTIVLQYAAINRWVDIACSVAAARSVAPTPTPGAEKEIVAGARGATKKITFAITGDGVKTNWVLEHGLKTRAVFASAETSVGGEASQLTFIKKTTATSTEEVELDFETAPGAGVSYFISVLG